MTNELTLITDIDNNPAANEEIKSYPLFVADQILTANHLNRVRDYLDQQIHFTRNKLLGSGIVCGFELKKETNRITLTKGTGLTSEGFLILIEGDMQFTRYKDYELPNEFAQRYTPIYSKWKTWELLTEEQYGRLEDVEVFQLTDSFLSDKVAVLFLEFQEQSLKNCAEMNCENKGDKVVFATKVLLMSTRQASEYFKDASLIEYNSILAVDELYLEREFMQDKELQSTEGLFNCFEKIKGSTSLKKLERLLVATFSKFSTLLEVKKAPVADFIKVLENIRSKSPYHIQYFRDWIEDLMMACNEFYDKAFDVIQSDCCMDETTFPLHLFLGEASKSTEPYAQTLLRNEFVSSPLFHQQSNSKKELKLLLERIYRMITYFNVLELPSEIKITPSRYLNSKLGERCIPYYYRHSQLFEVWNWEKSRRKNKHLTNLSYNASEHDSGVDDRVLNPLDYDLSAYDFLRIEGHVGHDIEDAFDALDILRKEKNLPFDLVALSSTSISRFFNAEDHFAYFEDLISAYEVLAADMKCKFEHFLEKACQIVVFESKVVADSDGKLAGKTPAEVAVLFDNAQPPFAAKVKGGFLGRRATELNRILDEVFNPKKLVNQAALGSVYNKTVMASAQQSSALNKTQEIQDDAILVFAASTQKVLLNAALKAQPLRVLATANQKTPETRKVTLCEALSFLLENNYTFGDIELSTKIKNLADFNAKFNLPVALGLTVNLIQSVNLLLELIERRKGLNWLFDNFEEVEKMLEIISFDSGEIYYILQWLRLPKISINDPSKKGLYDGGFYQFAKEIGLFINSCFQAKFMALFEEFNRRSEEMSFLTSLENYYRKHPGMEHKAGVPKGGTFILVYDGETPDAKPVIKKSVVTGAVIADFYLPYQCCSGSPSISFVISKQVGDDISLEVEKTEFYLDETKSAGYKATLISVAPEDGTLTIEPAKGLMESDGQHFFDIKGIEAGVYVLKYQSKDKELTKTLKVYPFVNAEFTARQDATNPMKWSFTAKMESDESIMYNWDLGEKVMSTQEGKVNITFSNNEVKNIKLTVSNKFYSATTTQEIVLKKPELAIVSGQTSFCAKDKNKYELSVTKNDGEVNGDAVVVEGNAYYFVPTKAIKRENVITFTSKNSKETLTITLYVEQQVEVKEVNADVDFSSMSVRFNPVFADNKKYNDWAISWNLWKGTEGLKAYAPEVLIEKMPSDIMDYILSSQVDKVEYIASLDIANGGCKWQQTKIPLKWKRLQNASVAPAILCKDSFSAKGVGQITVTPVNKILIKTFKILSKELSLEKVTAGGEVTFVLNNLSKLPIGKNNFSVEHIGEQLNFTVLNPDASFMMVANRNAQEIPKAAKEMLDAAAKISDKSIMHIQEVLASPKIGTDLITSNLRRALGELIVYRSSKMKNALDFLKALLTLTVKDLSSNAQTQKLLLDEVYNYLMQVVKIVSAEGANIKEQMIESLDLKLSVANKIESGSLTWLVYKDGKAVEKSSEKDLVFKLTSKDMGSVIKVSLAHFISEGKVQCISDHELVLKAAELFESSGTKTYTSQKVMYEVS